MERILPISRSESWWSAGTVSVALHALLFLVVIFSPQLGLNKPQVIGPSISVTLVGAPAAPGNPAPAAPAPKAQAPAPKPEPKPEPKIEPKVAPKPAPKPAAQPDAEAIALKKKQEEEKKKQEAELARLEKEREARERQKKEQEDKLRQERERQLAERKEAERKETERKAQEKSEQAALDDRIKKMQESVQSERRLDQALNRLEDKVGSGGQAGAFAVTGEGQGGAPSDNPYQMYYNEIWQRVQRQWVLPESVTGRGLVAVVVLRLGANGRLLRVWLERSSGLERLDQSAIRAVERAAPFPPLPPGLRSSGSHEIGFNFRPEDLTG